MSSIVLLSGTNRPGSNTRRVVAILSDMYRAAGVSVEILDLADLPLEAFAPTSYAAKPASLKPLTDAVLGSRGLHVVTPEYNGGLPGVLKYFIDLLPFPESFEHRPVCFTGLAAGMWGALRPVEQLQAIFSYRNAYMFPERVFLPGILNHLDDSGKLTNADSAARLKAQAEGFAKFVATLESSR